MEDIKVVSQGEKKREVIETWKDLKGIRRSQTFHELKKLGKWVRKVADKK